MLQGTFETLSLPEVLGLLASARKSGALWLDAGAVAGAVHLEDGHCRAAELGDERAPVADGGELLARLVDLCFGVMCQESGSFRFADADAAPWTCAEPVELGDAVLEVERLLKQWREIVRVIPSLECRPRLLEVLEVEELVVDRARWALLVGIDGRRSVRELVQRSGATLIECCQELLELIDAGAVGLIDPAAAREEHAASEPAPVAVPVVHAPDPETPFEPPSAEAPVAPAPVAPAPPAPAPVAAADAAPAEVGAPVEPFEAAEAPAPAERPGGVVLTIVPETPGGTAGEPAVPTTADTHVGTGPDDAAADDVEPLAAPADEPAPRGRHPHHDVAEGADRGAFLRLFSGLRDS